MKRLTACALLIVVGACSAFVGVLRNHAEIVLAHANRQSPESAALRLPQCSHSLGSPSVARTVHGNRSLDLNGPTGAMWSPRFYPLARNDLRISKLQQPALLGQRDLFEGLAEIKLEIRPLRPAEMGSAKVIGLCRRRFPEFTLY
jgi:hypothetical protein